jgi:hypothetical protein
MHLYIVSHEIPVYYIKNSFSVQWDLQKKRNGLASAQKKNVVGG